MKTLVTGGAGYFGELLVRRLHARGYHVRIFDIHKPEGDCPGIEVIQGDIRDLSSITSACRGIEVAFHNVAQVPLAKDDHLFWSVNRDGTRNLLEACVAQKVGKVIHTSSSAIYGIPKSNPVTEDTEPAPLENYGRTKLAGEALCWEYARRGLDVSIIRPRTILGHGRLGIFQILFEWIYQGRNVPVLNGGGNRYQFVHADDLAEACILAGSLKGAQAFNCGASSFGTMREVLEYLCRHAGTGSQVKSLPVFFTVPVMKVVSGLGLSPLGPYHLLMYGRSMYFDISKANRELGWVPKYSNDAMFVESYGWYLEHRSQILKNSHQASSHKSTVELGFLNVLQKLL
jgi:nucleoside-diphosphate-sugar epimerase